jgi:hypothetical protein
VTIQYGTVERVQTISKDAKHAGGALAGGVIGAMIGPRRHRGIRVLAGAGIGAAVQGSATSGTQQQYTVGLVSGGTTIINTEQQDIRTGDCVSIEQGSYSNIRRVSSVHCETKTQIPQHHKSISIDCEKAKQELTNAECLLILSEDRCPQHLLPGYIGGIAGGMSDVYDESILTSNSI